MPTITSQAAMPMAAHAATGKPLLSLTTTGGVVGAVDMTTWRIGGD